MVILRAIFAACYFMPRHCHILFRYAAFSFSFAFRCHADADTPLTVCHYIITPLSLMLMSPLSDAAPILRFHHAFAPFSRYELPAFTMFCRHAL